MVVTGGLDEFWDGDLIAFSRNPDGPFHFVLVCVDILSRFAFTRALKTVDCGGSRTSLSEHI